MWPAKTQISLYIHPVWQGFSFIPLWIGWRLYKAHAISKDWSEWVDAQADRVIASRTIAGFTEPWNIGHNDLDIVSGHSLGHMEVISQVWHLSNK